MRVITVHEPGVTKRCRLSLLTNSALVYESRCGEGGLWGLSQWVCTALAHHVTWRPNKLWRSTSTFTLWHEQTVQSFENLLLLLLYFTRWNAARVPVFSSIKHTLRSLLQPLYLLLPGGGGEQKLLCWINVPPPLAYVPLPCPQTTTIGQATARWCAFESTLIKKKRKFSSYIRKFRWDQLYMKKGFLIYEEMRKYLVIYEEAVSHIWLCNCNWIS